MSFTVLLLLYVGIILYQVVLLKTCVLYFLLIKIIFINYLKDIYIFDRIYRVYKQILHSLMHEK